MWTKKQKETAKREKLALVTIAVDGRTLSLSDGGFGYSDFKGPTPLHLAKEVETFLYSFMKKRCDWFNTLDSATPAQYDKPKRKTKK